ncbi:MAG: S8 family serine peptidase, partial [Pseudomonadota bacterium]|nr:S8 family serine peptidase [Pseudomonadota bacterium]
YLTQGTSVAAPQVTGAIGVLLSVCPQLTPEQIRTLLHQSADDLGPRGWDQHYGAGRLNLEALLKAAQNSPGCQIANADSCPQAPTIQSRRSGNWLDPSSWDLNRLPNRHDIVLVKASHQLTLPRQKVRVGSLCNYGQLTGTPRRRLTLMTAGKTAFIHNYGVIHAPAGADAKRHHCAQSGRDILLKVRSGTLHNHLQAYISAGDSGSNLQATQGCNRNWGGRTTLLAQEIINEGHISAGQGGDARLSLYQSRGGHGGRIYIRGNVGGRGQVTTTCGSLIQAGQGGYGYYGGRGGTLKLIAHRKVLCGDIRAGQGGYGMRPVRNGRAIIDPKSLLLKTQTHIWGGEVMLAGGAHSEFDFSALQTTAVTATETLTLKLGEYSQIKLPATTTSAIFKAQQQVNIFSDAELAQFANIITTPQGIRMQPAQDFSEVTLIAPGAIAGFAGEQLTLDLQLANDSSMDDSFKLQLSDTHGWSLSQLPTPIFIEAGGIRDETDGLQLQMRLPLTPGIQNTLTLTATSEHNPQLTATEIIEIEVLELPAVQRSDTTFSQRPVAQLSRCPTSGYINWQCRNEGQVITDAVLGPQANLAGGILAGKIDNQGFIAQIKIQAGAVVTGGTLSGYIVNEGVLADFDFVGAQIQGGTLAGQI